VVRVLRPTDYLALIVVFLYAWDVSVRLFMLSDPLLVFVFVTAWTSSAATQLIAFRRCGRSLTPAPTQPLATGLALLGAAPWAAIQVVGALDQSALMTPVVVSGWGLMVGVALTFAGIAYPSLQLTDRLTKGTLLGAAGFVFLCPSPGVGLFVASGVAVMGLLVTAASHREPKSGRSSMSGKSLAPRRKFSLQGTSTATSGSTRHGLDAASD
jgi:hypothetical protein